jgi:HAD superfamily hydrolase (TIGR01509 family)
MAPGTPRCAPCAVLFDLDATLFDHRACSIAGLEVLHARFDFLQRWSLVQLEEMYGHLLEELHERVLSGELTHIQARWVRMSRLLEAAGATGDADAMIDCYQSAYTAARRAVPGAAALLGALHPRAMIAIVTNNTLHEQLAKLEVCGLAGLVDALVVSHEVGCAKPDPAIFHIALERLAVPAHCAVMLGDSWSADVAGARAAGLAPVWFNPGRRPSPEPEVPQLHTLEPAREIAEFLLAQVHWAPAHG